MAVLCCVVPECDERLFLALDGTGGPLFKARRFGSVQAAEAFAREFHSKLPEGITLAACENDGWPVLKAISTAVCALGGSERLPSIYEQFGGTGLSLDPRAALLEAVRTTATAREAAFKAMRQAFRGKPYAESEMFSDDEPDPITKAYIEADRQASAAKRRLESYDAGLDLDADDDEAGWC